MQDFETMRYSWSPVLQGTRDSTFKDLYRQYWLNLEPRCPDTNITNKQGSFTVFWVLTYVIKKNYLPQFGKMEAVHGDLFKYLKTFPTNLVFPIFPYI